MSDYTVEIWNRDFEQPTTVVLSGSIGEGDAAQRFEQLRESVDEGRAQSAPLQYVTWTDVVGEPKGFTIEPANVTKIRMVGPGIDLDTSFE